MCIYNLLSHTPSFLSVLKGYCLLCSIVGGVLVILGLYLLLWAKAKDVKKEEIVADDSLYSPLVQP